MSVAVKVAAEHRRRGSAVADNKQLLAFHIYVCGKLVISHAVAAQIEGVIDQIRHNVQINRPFKQIGRGLRTVTRIFSFDKGFLQL